MKCNKDDVQAVEQAKNNFADLKERGESAIGSDALALLDTLLTTEEIMESNLRVALIGEIIKARQEKGISQRQLGELSGVRQPIIARMEKGITSPQLDTVLKILAPLGKTLAIVPLEGV
ncbi:MAG: helix-turn-helix transcriptional regulator [Phascolarctobacterium sp.]|nr:helix-turn-helix transcriptional regulator [Phascolarctobacterium sp.]